jgi:hypothetical protein
MSSSHARFFDLLWFEGQCATIERMNPSSPRFRKYAPWAFRGAIVIAVLAVIIATQLSASRRNAQIASPGAVIVTPFTGFGGYSWAGTVRDIRAQWRVPTIASDSKPGVASTWIGIQNGVNNQFIQIGIEENDFGSTPFQYQAFWSDLDEGFSPQAFGDVYPGDVVAVAMVRQGGGWALSLVDKSRHLNGKQFVKISGRVPFTQGEWIQEDPSPSTTTAQDLPYPDLSTVDFQDLVVNGSVPQLAERDGSVLITSGGTVLVPTPLVNASFRLLAPRGVARQYLDDEQTMDRALNEFKLQLSSWKSASNAKKSAATATLSMALKSDVTTLSSQHWPAASSAAVARLIGSDQRQMKDLKTWSHDEFSAKGLALERFQSELTENTQLVDAVRSTLRLPPL